ncbi:sialate O-acetylesterase [Coraliomargarita parva]|uniref:sialate O-acetylesterase n=1 Tax=Coraliomargarita parva TaxID=3014050 RepID=UPI0022B333EC|nr:sialate O-acetylesterase [Coraliomargarita parva]
MSTKRIFQTLYPTIVISLFAGQIDASVLSHYTFDTGYSDNTGTNNGSLQDGGTADNSGIATTAGYYVFGGGALTLSGESTDYVALSTTTFDTGAGEAYSIAFWARRADISRAWDMVIGHREDTANFIGFTSSTSNINPGGLRLRGDATDDVDAIYDPDNQDEWHHYVVSVTSGNIATVYIDGVVASLEDSNDSPATTFTYSAIGDAYSNDGLEFEGQIDEVWIFDEAIDAATVNYLYQYNSTAEPVADTTAPTLAGSDIVDDASGGPVTKGDTISYTVAFSENIDDSTVDISDFGNAGTAAITINSVSESSPGSFTVEVTLDSEGTLQLTLLAGSIITDESGNALDTSEAITDDTTLDVLTVKHLQVFLIGGQSNADGRAPTEDLPTSPENLQAAQDDVDFFYLFEGGSETLTSLQPGLSENSQYGISQFGPAITFGRELSDSIADGTTTRVAIIKYANGGTNLYTHWKAGGDATTDGDGPEYVTFQETVADGLAALATAYPDADIEIQGMLWLQGESDCDSDSYATAYEANLSAFIDDLRATFLNSYGTYESDLLFIIARLSSAQTYLDATRLAMIREAQVAVADADARAVWIDTDNVSIKESDHLHFDADGQQALGLAAAEKVLEFPVSIQTETGGSFSIGTSNALKGLQYTLFGSTTLDNWTELTSTQASDRSVSITYTPTDSDDNNHFFILERSVPEAE